MSDESMEKAVTPALIHSIVELQSIACLSSFALAGGTNLAFRFNHRRSIDIDLFSSQVIGKTGFEYIQSELETFYGKRLINCEIIDPEMGEQYCFLRAFILKKKDDLIIKVEIIQNIPLIDPIEYKDGIRMLSLRDIGLLKLMSASSRKAKKDIYDLDFITDHIPLPKLFDMLSDKLNKFSGQKFESLFDLDKDQNPIENIYLLLAFDEIKYNALPSRPNYSHDSIDILPSGKNWPSARAGWRRKVIDLLRSRGLKPPPVKPIN
ncbi:Nucleotidyl transferase AbiEii toxin, Type IV TA system [Chitinophaga sp. YR627]|uniref:nucleotidyl transferase AbiEii/AbiGii toxin family protein n=1 Tax=Chitinophaga sp. YR627 TaxID=1881041 RepID=UPI0008EFCEEB|nr:nucleotidyl transferase AbiEii/AbiGii toxin family protein [Chitinophaga sp. YR627]SFO58457.1 Nucleotidyl transferase AbiEii toxin, Type IV TA system [Chitinophaga sp. YR627]